MRPVIFSVGGLQLGTHDFFVFLGVVAATGMFLYEAHRRRVLSEDLLWIVVGSLFLGAVFAKAGGLWDLIAGDNSADSAGDVIARGGRTILGGLAGAYFGAIATKRIVGYRAKTGDLFAPAVALGMVVGRWGCYFADEVEAGTMHPSFLYEIAFHAVAFVVLIRNRDRVPVPGELLKLYLFAYALFRFGIEFVRGNEVIIAGLTGSQLFLIPSTLLLGGYLMRQLRRGAYGRLEVASA
jgi:prolipoprotein diacylglyceryltransferase